MEICGESKCVAEHSEPAGRAHNGLQRCNGTVLAHLMRELTMTTTLLRALRFAWRFLMADGKDMSYLTQARERAL